MKTTQSIIQDSKFLTVSEVYELAADLMNEFDSSGKYMERWSDAPHYSQVAWFLREYCYAPMKLIHGALYIKETTRVGAAASQAVRNYENSCGERPCSLDSEGYQRLQVMKQIASQYYGVNNLPMDRLNDDISESLLYVASLNFGGFNDVKKSQGGTLVNYVQTPQSAPALVSLIEAHVRLNLGEDALDVVSSYEIKTID